MTELEYHRCDAIDPTVVHAAFSRGFSDYVVQFSLGVDAFEQRFFGIECNQRACSFVALVDGEPAGLILGGVRTLEGVRTMRMGAMAIVPEHRGRLGLSRGLFERHRQSAREAGCAQLWLEVIVGNDRAIAFYRKQGYEPVGRLGYYHHDEPGTIVPGSMEGPRIEPCSLADARGCATAAVHVNWQNQAFCIEQVTGQRSFAVVEGGGIAGAIGLDPSGRIDFLYVREPQRRRGLGTALLATAIRELQPAGLSVGTPSEPSLDAFLLARGFRRRSLEQHEMRRTAGVRTTGSP
ncbi:GNAT family N-acetyltransferase [Paraliomyxa miuraensis]|uniref:GNAT family N-acetyltransferase n=1 Tax=Paraliomyxa miuraensis TaxID=376150 RepID=UPI00224D5F6B|nr:GNAT family N-acetyltransferase [Paraliomyxa miuraensis]MCX4243341.1 GNAT family N-acetyltransferase [Paraliomyxa miuraensis]